MRDMEEYTYTIAVTQDIPKFKKQSGLDWLFGHKKGGCTCPL